MDFSIIQNMDLYTYLVGGGVVLVVLAVILYLLPTKKLTVPGIVVGTLGGFAAGAGLGVIGMTYNGYRTTPQPGVMAPRPGEGGGPGGPGGGPGGPGGPGGASGKRGGGPGGGGPGGGARGPGPDSKAQLASLVGKLDLLTRGPVELKMSEEQRAQVREQLKGLTDKDELSEEDAKKRFDELLKVVGEDRKTLEAVGFRWPGGEGGRGNAGGGPRPANPFKSGPDADNLKKLQERLGAK